VIYGLCGPSGNGKSTLAKLIAESLDIAYLPVSISETARAHGYDSVGALDLTQRFDLQTKLLLAHEAMLSAAKRPAILDRTPIDLIAYMMCEVDMHSHETMTPKLAKAIEQYVEGCLALTRAHYDMIFVLGKLSTYEEDPKRPATNPAYHRHTDLVMKGAVMDLRGEVPIMSIAGEALEFRFDMVHDAIVKRLDKHERRRRENLSLH
jgi:nicotinamide riboside kinase